MGTAGAGPAAGWRAATLTGSATGRGLVPLRPLTVSDVLDQPFVLLRADLRLLLLLTGLVVVPVQLVSAYLQRGAFGGLGFGQIFADPVGAQVALETGATGTFSALGVAGVAAIFFLPLVNGLVARLAVSRVLGEDVDGPAVLRSALGRWPALIGVTVLAGIATYGPLAVGVALIATGQVAVAVVGGLVLLVAVPVGVACYVLFAVAQVAVMIERLGPVAALRRSLTLVRPRVWTVLGVLLLAALVASLVQSALSGLPSAAAFFIGFDVGWLLLALGGSAAALVVTPYAALVATMVYLDARVRTEALDLAVLADVAGSRRRTAGG